MTIPHLMNCPHSGEGWCLDCVRQLMEGKPKKEYKLFTVNISHGYNLEEPVTSLIHEKVAEGWAPLGSPILCFSHVGSSMYWRAAQLFERAIIEEVR